MSDTHPSHAKIDLAEVRRQAPTLNNGALRTLHILVNIMPKNGTLASRQADLAARINCTDRTLRNHLAALKSEDMISISTKRSPGVGLVAVCHIHQTDKLRNLITTTTGE